VNFPKGKPIYTYPTDSPGRRPAIRSRSIPRRAARDPRVQTQGRGHRRDVRAHRENRTQGVSSSAWGRKDRDEGSPRHRRSARAATTGASGAQARPRQGLQPPLRPQRIRRETMSCRRRRRLGPSRP
jgi:hypothetical protein